MLRQVPADHDANVDFGAGFPGVDKAVAPALVAGEDRMLLVRHGGDLRCFGRSIPWCLDQTPAVGDRQQRGG